MMAAWPVLRDTIAQNRGRWLALTLGTTALYYLALLISASISVGDLPNYVTFYDWPANVWRIIRSTPAVADMAPIIADEWLVEIGHLNRHYGHGIAEWSLEIIPSRVAVTLLLGALAATSILLLQRSRATCSVAARGAGATAAGLGAVCIGTANITMTWVACCGTPTWVVGLSLIGIETASAFALLPYGGDLTAAGFGLLVATNYLLARRIARPPAALVLPGSLAMLDR